MKALIFAALLSATAISAFAQQDTTAKTDTATDKGVKFSLGTGEDATRFELHKKNKHTHDIDTTADRRAMHKAPGFSFGITLARIDLGLATLVDNGSFTLSQNNNFLRYRSWKTVNDGFDVIQFGYRFNSTFKIYVSGGFDWTLIRLRDNITIQKNDDMSALHYTVDNIDYSKNRFSASYLRIPLSFDFRSHDDSRGKKFHFVAGPDIGLLLNGRVKQISNEHGKQKFNDDYHFTKMRYGAFVRVGYGAWGIFGKYYFNDMFDTEAQKGLKNFSFGIMLGF